MTTLFDVVRQVSEAELGIEPRLSPEESKTGAMLGDISNLVKTEAERLYPYQPLSKVSQTIGRRRYTVIAYPPYMIEEFIKGIIVQFIREHRPFDAEGNVVYGRHVPTEEERRARTEAKLRAKYGDAYQPRFGRPAEVEAPPKTAARAPPKTESEERKIVYSVKRR